MQPLNVIQPSYENPSYDRCSITMWINVCVLLFLCVVVFRPALVSLFLFKSTGLYAQSTELHSTQGLTLQRQTAVEQVIYSTCQQSRCSSRMFQCFSFNRCLHSYMVSHRLKPEGSMTITSTPINTGSQLGRVLMCFYLVVHVWLHLMYVTLFKYRIGIYCMFKHPWTICNLIQPASGICITS